MSEHNATISDFCNIASSKRIFAREYQSEGIPFWRGKEIVEKFHGKLEVSTELFIPIGRYDEIKAKSGVPKVGDILLTSVGTIGVPYLVSDKKPFYFKDGNITWLQTNETVCAAYLYYWLISPTGKRELSKCTIGVAQPAYTIVRLKQMSVSFPDLPTQERIAAILSAYDDLIENNRRRIALLEQAARLLYREWFVHFRFPGHETEKFVDGLPEGWEKKQVKDLLSPVKAKPKIRKDAYEESGPFPCVDQGQSFVGGFTINSDAIYRDELPLIVFGDHTRALKFVDFPFARGADGTQLIKSKENRLSQLQFYLALVDVDLSNYAYARHFKFLKDQEIVLPDQETGSLFTECVRPSFRQIQTLRDQRTQLTKARDLLLPRLMDGRILV